MEEKSESERKTFQTVRPEFTRGEVPLKYSYTFSKGERLDVSQDENGIAYIGITRGEKSIFDASRLLPPDFKFVTPTYFIKSIKEYRLEDYHYNTSGWAVSPDRKMVLVGEFRSPRDLLTLLHEIGHVQSPDKKLGSVTRSGKEARIRSREERRAWAWAISTFRKIEKDTGIDFRTVFPTQKELKRHIDNYLASHRQFWEQYLGNDPTFSLESRKLFDKVDRRS